MNPVNAHHLLQAIEKENPNLSRPEEKFLRTVYDRISSGLYLSNKQGKWLRDIFYNKVSCGRDWINRQYLGYWS